MPGLRNQGVHRQADFVKNSADINFTTVISQTSVVLYKFTPGYRFRLVRASTFCSAKAGAVSGVIKIGGRTAGSLVFTAATEVLVTLSTTRANIQGTATEAITLEYTTDGSGSLTNGLVSLLYRPWPLNGDLGPV